MQNHSSVENEALNCPVGADALVVSASSERQTQNEYYEDIIVLAQSKNDNDMVQVPNESDPNGVQAPNENYSNNVLAHNAGAVQTNQIERQKRGKVSRRKRLTKKKGEHRKQLLKVKHDDEIIFPTESSSVLSVVPECANTENFPEPPLLPVAEISHPVVVFSSAPLGTRNKILPNGPSIPAVPAPEALSSSEAMTSCPPGSSIRTETVPAVSSSSAADVSCPAVSLVPVNTSSELFHDASSLPAVDIPTLALINTGLRKLHCNLPSDWFCTADSKGFNLLFLSSGPIKAIQRQVSISYSGQACAFVHCKPCPLIDEVFRFVHTPLKFSIETLDDYCACILSLVEVVSQYTICIGANQEEFRGLWSSVPNAFHDSNPYLESSYVDTLRSQSCLRVVPFESDEVRCDQCKLLVQDINGLTRIFGTTERFRRL